MSQTNNQLVKIDQKYGKEQLAKLSGATYLPSVRLMAKTADLVTADKIKQGNYALIYSGGKFEDLTNTFDSLVLVWRPFAMQRTDDSWESSNDPESDVFKDIERNADANPKVNDAMCGTEFLIYIASAKKFAHQSFTSKTAKACIPMMLELMGKTATVKSDFVKKKKSYWVPVITACTTPFTLPSQDEINEQIVKFNNPPKREAHDPVEKKPGRVR